MCKDVLLVFGERKYRGKMDEGRTIVITSKMKLTYVHTHISFNTDCDNECLCETVK